MMAENERAIAPLPQSKTYTVCTEIIPLRPDMRSRLRTPNTRSLKIQLIFHDSSRAKLQGFLRTKKLSSLIKSPLQTIGRRS